MIKIKKINNIEVNNYNKLKNKPIFHKDLFDIPYFRLFIVGKTGSGKTNTLMTILNNIIVTNYPTEMYIFSSTHDRDPIQQKIINKFAKFKKIKIETYNSLYDNNNFIPNFILQHFDEEDNPTKKKEDENNNINKITKLMINDDEEEKPISEKMLQKYNSIYYCKRLIIIDDLSNELKQNRDLQHILKRLRHYQCSIIILSQYYYDISKDSREQLSHLILYSSINNNVLDEIYKENIHKYDFNTFKEIYEDATKDKYNFLFIDINNQILRKNLNMQYKLDN